MPGRSRKRADATHRRMAGLAERRGLRSSADRGRRGPQREKPPCATDSGAPPGGAPGVSMENQQGEAPVGAASDYVSEGSFDDLGLSEPLRRAVAEHGYTTPTPVQSASYRPIRDGKDVIVRSKTGTGKTAAFGLPMLERIPDGRRKASALIMT